MALWLEVTFLFSSSSGLVLIFLVVCFSCEIWQESASEEVVVWDSNLILEVYVYDTHFYPFCLSPCILYFLVVSHASLFVINFPSKPNDVMVTL